MDLVPVLREFGLPTVCVVVLAWALAKYHSKAQATISEAHLAHISALNSRIDTLEGLLSRQGDHIKELEASRYLAAQEFAQTMKDCAVKVVTAMHESSINAREVARALNRQADVVEARPCLRDLEPERKPQALPRIDTEPLSRKATA